MNKIYKKLCQKLAKVFIRYFYEIIFLTPQKLK